MVCMGCVCVYACMHVWLVILEMYVRLSVLPLNHVSGLCSVRFVVLLVLGFDTRTTYIHARQACKLDLVPTFPLSPDSQKAMYT